MNQRWLSRPQDPERAGRIAARLGLHPSLAQCLINRGLGDPEAGAQFLSPSLNGLANPFDLPDLEKAAERLAQAVMNQEKIGLFSDYDADGVTSAAVFINFLRALGREVVCYLPNRLTQGYGLNRQGVELMAQEGVRVLALADCGTTDLVEIEKAKSLGLEVIVTDHHQLGPVWPSPLAFVNPLRPDSPAVFRDLAGVGVVFFLLVGLRAKLRDKGFFQGRPEPNLRDSLDLVTLGTLADVAPVIGQNRILLTVGLKVLGEGRQPGLVALAKAAGLGQNLTPRDVVFGLAPRINAAGRLESPHLALELLTQITPGQAETLARGLDKINRRRQQVEQDVLAQAVEQLSAQGDPSERLALVAADPDWHLGVLGIVASRLTRLYYRPAFVLKIEGDTAVGSGRSIESFHLHRSLQALHRHLITFGGHALAAGLRLPAEGIPAFALALENEVGRNLSPPELTPSLGLDAPLDLDDLDDRFMEGLVRLAPFGPGNTEPLFWADQVGLISARTVGPGQAHLFMYLRQGRMSWPAIGFNLGHLIEALPSRVGLAFRPGRSTFRGQESLRLQVEALRPA